MISMKFDSKDEGEGKFHFSQEDVNKRSFANNSFGQVISAHVRKHLFHPFDVMCELVRVLNRVEL
jgi:hypothetical protein